MRKHRKNTSVESITLQIVLVKTLEHCDIDQ